MRQTRSLREFSRHGFLLAPLAVAIVGGVIANGACAADADPSGFQQDPPGDSPGAGSGGHLDLDASSQVETCGLGCSPDLHSVVDCQGKVVQQCAGTEGCDGTNGTCADACTAAINNKNSVGCEYYATFMDQFMTDGCFAVFVANTWNAPAHITVERGGEMLPIADFARFPSGSGPGLGYQPFDPAAGIPPGELLALFLSGPQGVPDIGFAPCPIASAVPDGVLLYGQTGIGESFRIASDVPVVAYEINPFGGGSAAVTGSSLLLPTSAWDTNYIGINSADFLNGFPSMNIVAAHDNTKVTILPVAAVQGGGGVPGGPANAPLSFTLGRGQHAQLSQEATLTGSVIEASQPVGLMGGHQCMNVPLDVLFCDHGEQMIPPVRALGSEYVGVMHRPRLSEPAIWRLVGAVDDTELTWSNDVGGPATLKLGQVAEFTTGDPFVVKSQDEDHPFMLFTYMVSSNWTPALDGYGDADFVISVPPQQYLPAYVFFTDPTYPETNIVVIRSKLDGEFKDVDLDCAGPLGGWQPIGDYEWTRQQLVTGKFQGVGACSTGRHEIKSEAPFGLWVWGWGTPQTEEIFTMNVSYGYPGGMSVQAINQVIVPAEPK